MSAKKVLNKKKRGVKNGGKGPNITTLKYDNN